jgi:cytochrome P450
MVRDANELVEQIAADESFDAHAAMTKLTLRIASETLFGSDESDSARAVAGALDLMMREFPYMLTPLSGLRQRLPLPATRRFWRARAMLDEIIYGLIAARRSDGQERGDALSMLLEARDVQSGYRPPDDQIRDEIMTLFLAGHETTANALTWALVALAQNPEVDERAGTAARDGDRAYLGRLVKEVLRLYPPAWILGREALRDVRLVDGSNIAVKTTVFMAPLVLHRRPDHFPDPQRFDPDRWCGDEPPPFAYVPFGGGARRCIGEEFALGEILTVLEALLRRFRFQLRCEVAMAPSVTLRPAGPVMMVAVARAAEPALAVKVP